MTIFGQLLGEEEVEEAVVAHLRKWLPTYLSEVERQHGLPTGTLQRPRSWTAAPSRDAWPEDQLPCVFVVCAGLADEPTRHARDGYLTKWAVGVACIVTAGADETNPDSRLNARRLASRYGAAVRGAMLQHRDIGGFAAGTDWVDYESNIVPSNRTRTLHAGESVFAISVESTIDPWKGPAVPDPKADPEEPYGGWPVVTDTDLTLEVLE